MEETLTIEQVRAAVVAAGFAAETFDGWMAEHDDEVREAARNDAFASAEMGW